MKKINLKIKPMYKKIIFYVVLGLLLIPITKFNYTFAKYVFDRTYDNYLLSKDFYFESNLLTRISSNYSTDDWNGKDPYDFSFKLNNFIDDLRWTDENIDYTISVDCDPSTSGSVDCDIQDGTIVYSNLNGTSNVVHLILSNPDSIEFDNNDYVDISISVTSTSPYRKTISAVVRVGINYNGIVYRITDGVNQKYINLYVANTTGEQKNADLSWQPTVVAVDNSNYVFRNSINKTTMTINSIDYYSGCTITIPPYTSYFVRYYKENIEEDYTYPVQSGTSIITVTSE